LARDVLRVREFVPYGTSSRHKNSPHLESARPEDVGRILILRTQDPMATANKTTTKVPAKTAARATKAIKTATPAKQAAKAGAPAKAAASV
jgi:hypothetical protein